jgi:hypothetical protein
MTQAVDTASAKPLVQNHSTTKKEKKKSWAYNPSTQEAEAGGS